MRHKKYIKITIYLILMLSIAIIWFIAWNRYWERISSLDDLLSINSYELQSILPSFTQVKVCNETDQEIQKTHIWWSSLDHSLKVWECSWYFKVKYLYNSLGIQINTVEKWKNKLYSIIPTDLVWVKKIWYGKRTIHINSLKPYNSPATTIMHSENSISYTLQEDQRIYDNYKIIFWNTVQYGWNNFDLFETTLLNWLNSESKKSYFINHPNIDINIIDDLSRLKELEKYDLEHLSINIFEYNLKDQDIKIVLPLAKNISLWIVDKQNNITYINKEDIRNK